MNMLMTTNKIINFSNRNTLSFIIKECDFSLLQVARQAYYCLCKESNGKEPPDNIIEIPIQLIFKQAICSENLNKPIKTNDILMSTKNTIENICNCLNPIAKKNCNRFIFKNLDVNIYCNKALFSRLILNLCYQLLADAKKNSAIEIISYLDVEQYIIEITTEYVLTEERKQALKTINPILEQLNSDFSYEKLETGEITFKITMPYENTRF